MSSKHFSIIFSIPVLVFLLLPFCLSSQAHARDDTEVVAETKKLANQYRLTAGDQIEVHVLGQDDLNVEVQVSDTNTIIFPLIGELTVGNLTREEVEQLIHDALKDGYLINPEVSVLISSYRQIYLQGEVNKPGPYPYAPGLSLRRAILNAGGFTETASKGKIYVVNEFDTDSEQKKINLGYQLVPGDIITVKASFF